VYRKYDGSLHWHMTTRRLGQDEHGVWLGLPGGGEMRKGSGPAVPLVHGQVLLIPHDAWWTASFNERPCWTEIYCDITTPPQWLGPNEVTAIDLDLDVIRRFDADTSELLDADEFAEHQVRYAYPPDVIEQAVRSADWLSRAVLAAEPFTTVYRRWLSQVANGRQSREPEGIPCSDGVPTVGMASRSRIADVHSVVVANMPDYQIDSVVQVGEGLDNLAYEVNGELIVRFSKEPDPARRTALLNHEARLFAAVADISPLPVPEPIFTAAEQGYLAYFKLPGVPLLDISRHQRSDHGTSIAATLGELLTAMHAVPVDGWTDLVDTDDHPLAEWRREAAETYMTIAGQVPAVHRRAVETFLDAPPPRGGYTPAFSHNDLGIEHVLIDPVAWTVTGIIDWSDAAIVDPACDFGLLYRDLGPAAFRVAIRCYRTDANDVAALTKRAVFYARCSVFEDLAYGIETGRDEYVDKCLAAMEWLFPA
jgi:aminoglycoside phosphotransferase (APT) family kinase protein